jgi:hypothetical protein
MRKKIRFMATLLAAGGLAVGLGAPTAAAAPRMDCVATTPSATKCVTDGHASLHVRPNPITGGSFYMNGYMNNFPLF